MAPWALGATALFEICTALGLFHNAALGCAPLTLVTLLWAAKAFLEETQKCQCAVVWQSCESQDGAGPFADVGTVWSTCGSSCASRNDQTGGERRHDEKEREESKTKQLPFPVFIQGSTGCWLHTSHQHTALHGRTRGAVWDTWVCGHSLCSAGWAFVIVFFCCCCLFLSKGAPQAQERSLVSHLEEDTAELSAGCLLGSGRFGLAGPSSPVPAAGKRRQGNISPAVIGALRGHLGRWRHSQISGRCATEPPLQQCLGRRSRRQHLSGPGRARC